MLKRLHLRNFTVFADAEFEFGEGLNVLVGTNGTGKSQVLKAGYVLLNKLFYRLRNSTSVQHEEQQKASNVREKLINVFQPDSHSEEELIRRGGSELEASVEIEVSYSGETTGLKFVFSPNKSNTINISPINGKNKHFEDPVFIPAKEVLTLSWLLAIYDYRRLQIDETYPDLLRLLTVPPLREYGFGLSQLIEQLKQIIGGEIYESFGRFYLLPPTQPEMAMNLVAEGMRKFATLYKLLANGTLTPETTLFWDEPEANLNPALLKELAVILTDLGQAGFQIILATHSLFLMKELHILARQRKRTVRYFGLYAGEKGDVQVERQDDFMQLQHIAALDAELAQTFDFEEALDQDYAADT